MPVNSAEKSPFYYSFDYGPVHFLVYSSEHPFGTGTSQLAFIQVCINNVVYLLIVLIVEMTNI